MATSPRRWWWPEVRSVRRRGAVRRAPGRAGARRRAVAAARSPSRASGRRGRRRAGRSGGSVVAGGRGGGGAVAVVARAGVAPAAVVVLAPASRQRVRHGRGTEPAGPAIDGSGALIRRAAWRPSERRSPARRYVTSAGSGMTEAALAGERLDAVARAQLGDLGLQRRVAALERRDGVDRAPDAGVELEHRDLHRDDPDQAEADDDDPRAAAHEAVHRAAGGDLQRRLGDAQRDRGAARGEPQRRARRARAGAGRWRGRGGRVHRRTARARRGPRPGHAARVGAAPCGGGRRTRGRVVVDAGAAVRRRSGSSVVLS